jgi:hypothetical protein
MVDAVPVIWSHPLIELCQLGIANHPAQGPLKHIDRNAPGQACKLGLRQQRQPMQWLGRVELSVCGPEQSRKRAGGPWL